MTCSKRFGRLLQASCLGLIGTLTLVGCGGSDDPKKDAGRDGQGSGADGGPQVGKLTVTPASLDFQTVDVGSISTPQAVTVSVSVAAVAISPVVTGTGFSLATTTCTGSQAPNTTCTVSVKFSPATLGGANGVLTIGDKTISLSGQGVQPGVFTVPDRIDLGPVKLNATAAVTLPVAPSGAPLPSLACTSSSPTELAPNPATTTCPATGPVSASCVYGFTFTATMAGARNITVTCIGGTKTTLTAVAATVSAPAALAVSQSTALFNAIVNKTDDVVITVSNNGSSATVAAPKAQITSGDTDYAITANDCVVALAPLATCHVTVTFAPKTAGTKAGGLSVTDTVTTLPVVLTGNATADRNVAITPSPADFGSVEVGTPKATTFTMKNTGGTATGLITLSGGTDEFKIGSDQCSNTALAATTGQCTFVVTLTPAAVGNPATIINASDTAGVVASVKLIAVAIPAKKGVVLTMTPPGLDFGTIGVGTTFGPKIFTVKNEGDAPSGVLSVTKNDSTSSVGGASQFINTTTCTDVLAAGDTCQVAVTFVPTIKGSASATIIVGDGTAATKPATVVGIALDKPGLSINCAGLGAGVTYDFSAPATSGGARVGKVVGTAVGPVACIVKNDSTSTQETGVLTPAATGDFAVATTGNTCTGSLAPGLSCTLGVTFTPTQKGDRTGTLTVTGANGGAANVNLAGFGLGIVEIVAKNCPAHHAECLPLTISPYDFGQVTVGTSVAAKELTLDVYVRSTVGNLAVSAFPSTASFAYTSDASTDCRKFASASPTADPTSPVCSMKVQFTPKDRTVFNGTVTVTGANGKTDSSAMTGTGTGPITISPSPVTFSDVAVGTSSDPITITIRNGGAGVIKALAYTLTGANKDQFAVVYDAVTNATLATSGAGQTTTMAVRFIPTSAATSAGATITVTGTLYDAAGTTAVGTETQAVNLTGNAGVGASVTATIGNNGVFADTFAASISTPLTITVANAAGSLPTATIAAPTILSGSSDFTATPPSGQTQGTCVQATANPIAGGGSCTYLVWFTPSASSALAARSGTLQVAGKTLAISGTALPMLELSPAGTASAPVDVTASGVAIVNNTPAPYATFTVTNHAATDLAAGKLLITKNLSTNGPNLTSLFVVDATASNTCNGVVTKNGGTCSFKLSATATDPTKIGTFFGQVQVAFADAAAQSVKADVKATVATAPSLMFTASTYSQAPSTTAAPTTVRHFGAVELGASSTPVKFTVVNVGGSNSSAITAAIADTTAATKSGRWTIDASACTALGEAGLAPGKTCDILVTANVSPNAPTDASATITGTLAVAATRGTAGWYQGKLSALVDAVGTASQTAVYLVDDTSGLAPADLGITSGAGTASVPLTITKTIAFHNPTGSPVTLPDTAVSGWIAETLPASPGAEESVAIAGGTTAPCVRNTAVASGAKCTLTVTWSFNAAATVYGQRVFTVTVGSASMLLLGSVSSAASLSASRTSLDFGKVLLAANSQSGTVLITNLGETTSANLGVKLSPNTGVIHTSGCAGAPLAYGASCTLTLYVVPQATGSTTGTATLQLGGVDTSTVINLSWTGAVAAALGSANAPKDFGTQAVLSTTTNKATFTFSNGVNSLKTGPLAIAVVDSSGTVVPDFVVLPTTAGTNAACVSLAYLDTNTSCDVDVQFTPLSLSPAVKSGSLKISSTDGGSAAADLTGTAVAPLSVFAGTIATVTYPVGGTLNTALTTLTITATPSVASGGTTDVTIAFKNEAGAPTTGRLSAALTSTADLSSFLAKDDQCTGNTLAGGATCTVKVTFAPKSVGAKTATVTVSGTPGGSVSLVLNGTPTT